MKESSIKIIQPLGANGIHDNKRDQFLSELSAQVSVDNEWPEKYGTEYENDVFILHPYCWCGKWSCRWCENNYANYIYKPLDYQVTWYKYIGRSVEENKTLTKDQFDKMINHCFESVK